MDQCDETDAPGCCRRTTGARSVSQEPQLVEHQQLRRIEATLKASELASIARFEKRAYDVGRARKQHVSSLSRRLDAESDSQVRRARADRSREDHVVAARDPFAGLVASSRA
jgi:hypothetical protein